VGKRRNKRLRLKLQLYCLLKVRKDYHVSGSSCGREKEQASAAEVAAILHVKR